MGSIMSSPEQAPHDQWKLSWWRILDYIGVFFGLPFAEFLITTHEFGIHFNHCSIFYMFSS